MKIAKKISLITVVKDDDQNIKKTLESIIKQKSNLVEYIVIDGKSKDGTLKILNEYKKKIDLIISEKDKGIYDAMNKGIKLCSGKIVGFCNSGDIIFPGSIKIILNNFSKKKLDILFATVKRNYRGGVVIKSGFNINRIFYNFDFATSHSTGFYMKREIHNEVGLYDTKFKLSADYDMYLRLVLKNKYKFGSTPKKRLIGEMKGGGYSSKFSFFDHLNEESKIRFKNKQNKFYILLIYINACIKFFIKKFI